MFQQVTHAFPTVIREVGENSRLYLTPEGKRYPSVTTVISDHNKVALDKWRKRVGEEQATAISTRASTRGDAVHKALETLLLNGDTSSLRMMPHEKAVYVNMKQELVRRVTEVHGLEQPMYSDTLRLAGTTDCIARYDGVLSIVDFKTSLRLKKKEWIRGYLMQGVAYSYMFEELTGHTIDQVVILIGVDNCNFAQTFKLPKADYGEHLLELMEWRDKYERREAA